MSEKRFHLFLDKYPDKVEYSQLKHLSKLGDLLELRMKKFAFIVLADDEEIIELRKEWKELLNYD